MGAINETLRRDLLNPAFSEGYAESFQDAYVAAQIKVLREENNWTQDDLAKEIGTTQTAVSRIENVNYSAWNIRTLKKLARAFRLRLRVSFETYGSLIRDFDGLNRESLKRAPRERDPELIGDISKGKRSRKAAKSSRVPTPFFRARRKHHTIPIPRKPAQSEAATPWPLAPLNEMNGGKNNSSPMPFLLPNGNDSTGAGVRW